MSTTTKIFIVLVCLFAFIFTPMTIQFVARTNNWRAIAQSYQEVAQSSQVHNRNLIALTLAEKQAMTDELEAMRATGRKQQEEMLKLRQDLDHRNVEKARLESANIDLEGKVTMLSGAVNVKTNENKVLTEGNGELRQRNDELMTRNIDLNDRNKELSAQLLIREQKLRMMEEENLAIRKENERLRESGKLATPAPRLGPVGPGATAEPVGPTATSPIRGKVTDVQGDMAQIDVGSSDGVAKGMAFVVYRGGAYLGDLRIEVADPRTAVGRLELVGKGDIKNGDSVRDRASMDAAH